jgi:signal transduction histidine kinase
VRKTPLALLLALAAPIVVTLLLLLPVLSAIPFQVAERHVEWISAAYDLRPRRPLDGEEVRTLSTPNAVFGAQARQYTVAFEAPRAPGSGTAVLLPVSGPATRIFINAYAVNATSLAGAPTTLFATIPHVGYQAGANRIEVVVPSAAPYRWPRAILLGPAETLRAAGVRHALIQLWAMSGAAALGFTSAALGFLLVFFVPARAPILLPSLSALAIGCVTALSVSDFSGTESFWQPWARTTFAATASLLLLLLTVGEANPWPRSQVLAFRAVVAACAVLGGAALLSFWDQEPAIHLSHWAGTASVLIGAGGSLVLTLAGSAVRGTWTPMQRSVPAVAALALVTGALAEVGWLGSLSYLVLKATSGTASVLALAMWFGGVGFRAFLDVEGALQRRLGLGRIIREQEAKLKAQQEALEREIVQRAVHEERERFSRDVHDGVGGSLVGLLMQARTGRLTEKDFEAELQRALVDLRLMIDALDHSQATLPAAFSTFRTRITPVFEAAEVVIEWQQDDLDARALKETLSLLHVFRILQEACTNVIKHAGASRATMRISWDERANALDIELQDNGNGGGPAHRTGNGLKNMSRRAAKIGGTLAAGPASDARGWRVHLSVPGR